MSVVLSIIMMVLAPGAVIDLRRARRSFIAAGLSDAARARTRRRATLVCAALTVAALAAFSVVLPGIYSVPKNVLLSVFGFALPLGGLGYALVLRLSIQIRVPTPGNANLQRQSRREVLRSAVPVLAAAGVVFATPPVLRRAWWRSRWFKLHLVTLGTFPRGEVERLAEYIRTRFDIRVTILPGIEIEPRLLDPRRGATVEDLVAAMKRAFPRQVADPWALLVGVTAVDIYLPGIEELLPFVFGEEAERRYAVTSIARMDPEFYGQPPDVELRHRRLRKMLLRQIGSLYYRRWLTDSPSSVLYFGLFQVEDLDVMSEDF